MKAARPLWRKLYRQQPGGTHQSRPPKITAPYGYRGDKTTSLPIAKLNTLAAPETQKTFSRFTPTAH
eukprot:1532416-Pleurochrysis_carterae.AAC.1